MIRPFHAGHAFTVAIAIVLVGALLAGCKEETPPPSGSGYYSGPMKPKGSTQGDDTAKKPSSNAPGAP